LSLPSFSVRQTVLVNVLFFVCLGAGLVAYLETPVDFYPDISFDATIIETIWTGASADEVERLVTTKLEEEIQGVSGIKELYSWSGADRSSILITWNETLAEIEYESSFNDVRAAIDRVTDLPPDAEEPLVRELSVAEMYAVLMVAVVDVGGVGETALLEVARDAKSRLEDLYGIKKVVIRGEHDREIRVLVDREAAARYQLTVVEIADRIRRKNLNLPAGTFTGSGGEATLRATGDYESIEEILSTVVRENPNGTFVRVGDVARVEEGLEKRRIYSRYNRHPALVLGVAKESDADLLGMSERLQDWVASYARLVPEGVELHVTWNSAEWVSARMSILWNNLLTGVGFVMLLLWFTIGFRNAALTIIAIPFSFLTALILFPLMGITINSLSLVGMMLVSGMLVDDAIIVLENIYRRVESGEPLREAVVNGSEEVLWPVVAAVATTCAAFFPLLLMSGTSGEFMSIIPKTVIVCLVASLFECLVILPAHYLDIGSRHPPGMRDDVVDSAPGVRGRLRRMGARFERFHYQVDQGLAWLRGRYLQALDVVLQNRGAFAVLSASLFIFSMSAATHLPVDLFPSEFGSFFIVVETPLDYGLEQTDAVVQRLEEEVETTMLGDPLVDFSAFVGNSISGNDDQRIAPNLAVLYNWIVDKDDYRYNPGKVVKRVQDHLDAYRDANAESIVVLQAKQPRDGPPIGKPIAVRIAGDDYLLSKRISREMQDFLHTLPGVSNIEDSLKEGAQEVRLLVDQERAGQHGLTFAELAQALRGANDGLVASNYRGPDEGEEIDIRVLLAERFRSEIPDLLRTKVRAPAGYLIELGDVADVEITRGFQSLAHFDGKRTVTVYAEVDNEEATALGVNQALAARFADLSLRHPDVEVVYGGEFEVTKETFQDMRRVFPIALLLIYMILAALFRSYIQPLVVITAVPFGMIGVVVGVGAFGYDISIPILYAAIGLTGVVVNDSLVMTDFINRARASGMPLLEAVRQSGARRLRPILLTTLTTVMALLPMALGLAGGSKTAGPFAASIVFGLIFAMVGTLFMIPLAYTSLIVAQDRVRGWRSATRIPSRSSQEITGPGTRSGI
jgi:HAE1 family hydrophobic/amphiphilic exporter-1